MPFKNEAKRKEYARNKASDRRASFLAAGLTSTGEERKRPIRTRNTVEEKDLDAIALADPIIREGRL